MRALQQATLSKVVGIFGWLFLSYITYWVTNGISHLLPLVFDAVWSGRTLGVLVPTRFGLHFLNSGNPSLVLQISVALCIAAIVWVSLRRHPVASGFLIVWLLYSIWRQALIPVVFGSVRISLDYGLSFVAALVVSVIGLRLQSTGETFWARWVGMIERFVLPVTVIQASQYLRPGARILLRTREIAGFEVVFVSAAAALVLSFVAAVFRTRRLLRPVLPRRIVIASAGFALCLWFTMPILFQRSITTAKARNEGELKQVKRVAAPANYRFVFFQKGISLVLDTSGFTAGEGTSPSRVENVLDRLQDYGINAISLVFYGKPDAALLEAITDMAHARGMRLMLKPQMWTRQGFPGTIDCKTPKECADWFTMYGDLVDQYSGLAARIHADIFCIGTEFVKMSRFEKEWRDLISRARQRYPGPIVYAATQGPEFEEIRFWDALDYIGLDNYYPLPDDLNTDAIVAKIEAVQRRYQRPVLFTEAGFSTYAAPHRRPWDETPRAIALEDQARAYEAVLRSFYHRPWFQGVYWWKITPHLRGGPRDGSLTPWGKPAMEVLKKWYRSGSR